jgi:hypothetical protein
MMYRQWYRLLVLLLQADARLFFGVSFMSVLFLAMGYVEMSADQIDLYLKSQICSPTG